MLLLPNIVRCGYFDSANSITSNACTKRTLTAFEIEFFLEDNMFTYLDDRKYNLCKHSIIIARPGQVRHSSRPFKTMFARFTAEGDLAERLYAAPEFFISSHPERMQKMLSELALHFEKKDNDLLLYSCLLAFLESVLYDAAIPEQHSGANYKIVQTAKRYIEKHYYEPIHLEDIATAVNLSPIYFHNIFSTVCGQSPHDYLTKVRIDTAKKQLWDPTINICDIAKNCGFGSQQYFTKIFKKETGYSPAKYRKSFCQSYFE